MNYKNTKIHSVVKYIFIYCKSVKYLSKSQHFVLCGTCHDKFSNFPYIFEVPINISEFLVFVSNIMKLNQINFMLKQFKCYVL